MAAFRHGGKSMEGSEMSISVFSVFISVAESLGSPPSLERHHKMRFSIILQIPSSRKLADIIILRAENMINTED